MNKGASDGAEALANDKSDYIEFITATWTPLVQVALRWGFSCQEIEKLIRKIAVDVALSSDEFQPRSKPYLVQAACATGLSRKEVKRLSEDDIGDLVVTRQINRGARVLGAWRNDPRFQDNDGQPLRKLPKRSPSGPSFLQLVRDYAGDVTMRSVLNDLKRHGAVEEVEGYIELVAPFFVPQAESPDRLRNIARILSDVIATGEHNLRSRSDQAGGPPRTRFLWEFFQPYVPAERTEEAHTLIRKRSIDFARSLDEELAKMSHCHPKSNQGYVRLGLALSYFEDKTEDS